MTFDWRILFVCSFALIPVSMAIFALSDKYPEPQVQVQEKRQLPPSGAMQVRDLERSGLLSICDYTPKVASWRYYLLSKEQREVYRSCHGMP